jgi:hypothetical protein
MGSRIQGFLKVQQQFLSQRTLTTRIHQFLRPLQMHQSDQNAKIK